jgi:hypothetical protein
MRNQNCTNWNCAGSLRPALAAMALGTLSARLGPVGLNSAQGVPPTEKSARQQVKEKAILLPGHDF